MFVFERLVETQSTAAMTRFFDKICRHLYSVLVLRPNYLKKHRQCLVQIHIHNQLEKSSLMVLEVHCIFMVFHVKLINKRLSYTTGILQGTSSLLLCFDESEVRKMIKECKKVLDYLAVAEVIETMEDLVQFVKVSSCCLECQHNNYSCSYHIVKQDLSPCLTKVSRDVDGREKELTHLVHRDILVRCLDSVKTLAPILICSMKIFVQLLAQGNYRLLYK